RCRWPRRTGSTASSGAPGARATAAPCWPLSPDAEREAGLPERWERELQLLVLAAVSGRANGQ
ncbi:hypothetical protein, partial [Paenibacillus tepidiphilus]|uniref:hypothetical protein n=1 Tax=Paenibacillus tepidiphilus TaxID=2608683 RepID=UPI0013A598B7